METATTVSAENWELVILPQAAVYPGKSPVFRTAYRAWREAWEPVFQGVGETGPLSSDAFTRQNDRLVLFHQGQCAALCLFNPVDLSEVHHRADSYFEYWSDRSLETLTSQGPDVLVCSHFTVMADYRKGRFGFAVKDLLMGMLIRYFLESPHRAMTGTLRNSKGVNELCYRWGASPVTRDVMVHGEKSDLVAFFKDSVKPGAVPEINQLIDELWRNRSQGERYIRRVA